MELIFLNNIALIKKYYFIKYYYKALKEGLMTKII